MRHVGHLPKIIGVHGRTILKWIFRQERGDRITRTLGLIQRPFNVDPNRTPSYCIKGKLFIGFLKKDPD